MSDFITRTHLISSYSTAQELQEHVDEFIYHMEEKYAEQEIEIKSVSVFNCTSLCLGSTMWHYSALITYRRRKLPDE